jgi:hypothetical protein
VGEAALIPLQGKAMAEGKGIMFIEEKSQSIGKVDTEDIQKTGDSILSGDNRLEKKHGKKEKINNVQ